MFRKFAMGFLGLLCFLDAHGSHVLAADPELAKLGTALVKKYCYRCHGEKFNGSAQFNVMDRAALLGGKKKYVVPDNLAESIMWRRINQGEMPPDDQPQPSAAEKELLKAWLLAGAPQEVRPERPFLREEDVLAILLADLQRIKTVDRRYQRYFTLTHLYNNFHHVTEFDLRLYRAAFAKAINSLSWEPTIAVPKPIDPAQTIFRVDLREVGMDRPNLWLRVLKEYPYGLKFNRVDDPAIVELDRQVELLAGTPLAYVRADWFTVTATRPPLYHEILGIPKTDVELERLLKVDTARDFLNNRLKRAGFAESGVSTANRLLDRHPAAYQYYWKSYDFAPSRPNGNLFRYPLGPRFSDNPYPDQAFEHDGGELIFGLPNGLQGYMLVNGKGERIDEGPINVVRDLKETSGSPVVVNGLSCMHCHQHGMIDFKDTVRAGLAVQGDAREKARDLFVVQEEFDQFVAADRKRFLDAIAAATGPFLQRDDDAQKPIDHFAEPIGAIARFYFRDLGLTDAAIELGVADPNELKHAVKANEQLRRLGLGPFLNGASIKRSEWVNRQFLTSPFQEAARALERGTPQVFLGK